MAAPEIIKPIPNQIINEHAAYGPFDLKQFIRTPDGEPAQYSAELADGSSLPQGMICTGDGNLTGIPAEGTEGTYEIMVTCENELGYVQIPVIFVIKPTIATTALGDKSFDKIKAQIWEALGQNLPLPDLTEMFDRPITEMDVYYLIERWAVLTIYDAFNLGAPGEKKILILEGVSKHYNVYDRGSCLVAAPKDLYSHERTIEDAMQTARAMANEVYKRGWTVELIGFHKLTRAAWIQIQHLGDEHCKKLEVVNYTPSISDVKLYTIQAERKRIRGGLE